jgi:hypothetical protein
VNLTKTLAAFLSENGIEYAAGKKSFVTDCIDPSCGKEGHMYIRKRDGQSICFKCGTKWNWKWLVASIFGCSPNESYNVLHGRGAGDLLDQETPLDPDLMDPSFGKEKGRKRDPGTPIVLGPDFTPYHKSGEAMKYLDSRGVTNRDLLAVHDIRYHAAMDAVVFPVKENGKTYGWQARKIYPGLDEPKVITLPGFDKSKFLMGSGYWNRLVIVEGIFDLLHIEQADGLSAVALMGKQASLDQLKLILDSPANEIYIGLDEDAAEHIYDIVDLIGLHKKCFRIKPPLGKDFGDCTPEEIEVAMDKALLTTAMFLEVYFKKF